MLVAKAASRSHPEHGHRKVIAILDVTVAFFHTDMEDVICVHPTAEAEPDRTVVWLLIKAHYGTRKAARLWQESSVARVSAQRSFHECWLGRSGGGAKCVSQSWKSGR